MRLENIVYAHNSDVKEFISYAAHKAIDVDPFDEVTILFAEDCRSLGISYNYN